MLQTIREALEYSRAALLRLVQARALRERYESLSRREREVMSLVVSGRLNKQVGGDLGISEITVKAHRGKVMRKMQARSLPELVNMAARLRPSITANMADIGMLSEVVYVDRYSGAANSYSGTRAEHGGTLEVARHP
jgi:DNA-binding CsgD family transcriptional regulator